ncbi:acyl-CoA N-acyltransferase [Eremomyces bilateralis CBS 781.70]|uniref:Histone acetyltransferase type B catalytic subunit n=1 Tax=Eremomyces bilateralis CBS 781.70 TaxID=1392243 RepID=A0A6G1FSS5_9PEZI|nr:acyl-CoA N-acyltransferase [Eremomyces bilateralis CBS 781.70]KAF1808824.1 acyl-CoA N-acyltransferase [Eremomyces bilateralis CBS 781.70]
MAEWLSEANSVVHLALAQDNPQGKLTTISGPFPPSMTYAIFGEEEQIFGYKDLRITVNFRAHDMRPVIDIGYSAQFTPIGDVKPVDLKAALANFFPASALDKAADQEIETAHTEAQWTPPGDMVAEYQQDGRKFQIWRASFLEHPEAKRIFHNMQVLVHLFIEGGTTDLLDEPDDSLGRWKIYFLYEVRPSPKFRIPYIFNGFCTTHQFWTFPHKEALIALGIPGSIPVPGTSAPPESIAAPFRPPIDETTGFYKQSSGLDSPSRLRISQLIILPPFQRKGHGHRLYSTIFAEMHASKWTYELAVEDPSEEFDWLRDLHDYAFLLQYPEFAALSLPTTIPAAKFKPEAPIPLNDIVPQDVLKNLRLKSRIAKRQFHRIVEMHLLAQIPSLNRSRIRISKKAQTVNPDDRKYFYWCTYLKDRLYKRNSDVLIQLSDEERTRSLQAVVDAVQGEYEERFEVMRKRGIAVGSTTAQPAKGGAATEPTPRKSMKRPVVDDDEESDDEAGAGADRPRGKTPRID